MLGRKLVSPRQLDDWTPTYLPRPVVALSSRTQDGKNQRYHRLSSVSRHDPEGHQAGEQDRRKSDGVGDLGFNRQGQLSILTTMHHHPRNTQGFPYADTLPRGRLGGPWRRAGEDFEPPNMQRAWY